MNDNLPKKFYKYQKYSDLSKQSLAERYLWFSKPEKLNDPFDCSIPYTLLEPSLADCEAAFKHIPWPQEMIGRLTEEYFTDGNPNENMRRTIVDYSAQGIKEALNKFRDYGVACFTQNIKSILMWSHYADGHKGFCLEFGSDHLPFSDIKKIFKVKYTRVYPTLNPVDVILGRILPSKPELLLTKSSQWKYEKEWRLFKVKGDTKVPYKPEALTGIYFGCLMPIDQKKEFATMFHGTHTKLYEMKRSSTNFKLEISSYVHNS